MNTIRRALLVVVIFAIDSASLAFADEAKEVREQILPGPNGVIVKIRMQGPYDAETPLQIVCFFKHKESGDKTLGAAVELDKKLGGAISSLRNRGEFVGDELETILLTSPKDSIKPRLLLLIGLGDEESLSLQRMERVGRTALREASRLGIRQAAFAPLIRDQGNAKLPAGDVGQAVLRGVLLAYQTEMALQKEGLSNEYNLEQWVVEAGPTFFDETVAGVQRAIQEANSSLSKRSDRPFSKRN